jgi:hypothetical protein
VGVKISIDIQRPVEDVFAFASNSSNLPLYDEYITEVEKISEGPIGMGTKFHLNSNQFGLRSIVVQEFIVYKPSRYFAFRIDSGPFPVETHYALESHANGTLVIGEREPQPQGIWNWLIPLISIPAKKKFETELNNLKYYLESH